MSRALHHIALGAQDVERVAAFYAEGLGLREAARHFTDAGVLRSIWLAAGETVLMVERTEQEPRHVSGIGAGPFLLAFAVERDEREGLERQLERAGAAVEARTEQSSYFRDPEGNRFAISHYPLPRARD